MTKPTDINVEVLEENSNVQSNEENTENIIEENSGEIQPMASQVSLLYRAPAVLIDNRNTDISDGGENILFKYDGHTIFDGWYIPNNSRYEWSIVGKWWCPGSTLKYFQLYKNYDTNNTSDNIIFGDGGEWSNNGPTAAADTVSLGDNFQLTTDDEGWGIKWDEGIAIKNCFDTYGNIPIPKVDNERYDLCGFILFNGTNLSGWNEINAHDYNENENFVLYVKADDDSGLAFRGMSTDFKEYANFDRVYIAPVYKFVSSSSGDTGTVNFLQGLGIIINSFPDFTSKQYPELIKNTGLYSETVSQTNTDLFAGKNIDFNTINIYSESKTLSVDSNGNVTGEQFEVYKETGYDAYVKRFDHEKTEKYNFLGYVLTAMDVPGESTTDTSLSWFAPYNGDTITFADINYDKITDIGSWDFPYPYNYIRAVWLETYELEAYAHCPIDEDDNEHEDITWSAEYNLATSSSLFVWHDESLGSENTFVYNGGTRPAIWMDVNSLPNTETITITLSHIECDSEIIGWQIRNYDGNKKQNFNTSIITIDGSTLREFAEGTWGVAFYLVPIINVAPSTTFKYTNNTAWDVVVQVGEHRTTLDRWSTGMASITAESLDGAVVLFENKLSSKSFDFNKFAPNNELILNYDDSKLYGLLDGLYATYDILAFLPIYKTNVFTFNFSDDLGWHNEEEVQSSVNVDKHISIAKQVKVKLEGEEVVLEQRAKLVLGGYLNFNFDSCSAHNKNEELNVINYNYPPHSIDSPNSDDSTLTPVEHKVGTPETIQYWEHTDSVWGEESPYFGNNDQYKYNGNGIYAFIINMDDYSPDEKVIFDYEEYNCGTLLGYITSRDNDSQNTVLKNESEFLFGVVAPAVDNIVTIYGFDTNNSELYLLGDLVGDDPTQTYAAIINWGDGSGVGYEAYSKIYEFNYDDNKYEWKPKTLSTNDLPIDNSTYQTGNQFVVFRLRNPYDGKVLNHDEDAAYGVTTKYGNTSETHEQPYFLTIWEQRSIFNALNNKITFVNEVSSYEQVQIISSGGLPFGYKNYDKHGEINEDTVDQYGDDLTVYSLLRNNRKSGRALVDNIDDWFNWFKREEEPGIIANSQDNALAGGSPLMFVAPMLNDDYGCCIQSDAVQTSRTLGPGESISVPIVVLYKAYPEQNRDAVKYTIGFDVRNSLYLDPLYYQFTLNAKYSGSVTDSISSQKASIQSSTKYNVTVR